MKHALNWKPRMKHGLNTDTREQESGGLDLFRRQSVFNPCFIRGFKKREYEY